MKISRRKPDIKQLMLFDNPRNRTLWDGDRFLMGRARTIAGGYFEGLTAVYYKGQQFVTDSRADYCPDVLIGEDHYAEVKACGLSNEFLIYKGRLEKDHAFASALAIKFSYVVWKHNVPFLSVLDEQELIAALRASTKGHYCIPLRSVVNVAKALKVTKLNSKYGGSDKRPEYGEGYRMPISAFEEFFIEF